MFIDITLKPPVDIFRNRGKHRLLAITFLTLSCCGLLVGAYAIFSDGQHSKNLETVAFSLFVGAALVFSYFGEKLQTYKKLTPEQKKELADMKQKHPKIKAYCALVAKADRRLTHAEYEACLAWEKDANLEDS